MTAIPAIRGTLPAGYSARDVGAAWWDAHGIPGPNPFHANQGTVTFSWDVNPDYSPTGASQAGTVVEWVQHGSEDVVQPYRLQRPGEYNADTNEGLDNGTVKTGSPELDPIRDKGVGSGKAFENGDPNPDASGTFKSLASDGSDLGFVPPWEQIKAGF